MIVTEGWNTLPRVFPIILNDCSDSEVMREGALHPPALCSVEEIWFHLSAKWLYCQLFGYINNCWMFFWKFSDITLDHFFDLLLHSFYFLHLWFMLYASNEQMTDWTDFYFFLLFTTAHYEPLRPKCTSVLEDTDILDSAWSCILTMIKKKTRRINAREDKPTWQLRGKEKVNYGFFSPRGDMGAALNSSSSSSGGGSVIQRKVWERREHEGESLPFGIVS